MMSYDVIVIGAGVVGSAVARELSRYQLKTAGAGEGAGCGVRKQQPQYPACSTRIYL